MSFLDSEVSQYLSISHFMTAVVHTDSILIDFDSP